MNTFSVYMAQGWASQAISRVESNPNLFLVLSSRVESSQPISDFFLFIFIENT